MGEVSTDSFREWIPAGWPARSLAECEALLCAPGARFEYETIPIRGVATRVWKNTPENLAVLARIGRSHGVATFLIYEDERVSYEAWFRAVAALGRHLQSLGVQKGDRVALAMRNLPEWPVVFFAAVTIGAICVPLNAWWTGPELAYGLAHSGAKVLVCDGERLDRTLPHRAELPDLAHVIVSRRDDLPEGTATLESIIGPSSVWGDLPDQDLPEVAIAADDDATILYTSGAYGAARQVLRRGEALPEPARKVLLTVIPLFHATACSATMMGAIAAGHTMIFMYRWDPEKAFQIIEREKVNSTGGVPTIAWQLIEHPAREKYDLSSIEAIAYGGAPSAPDLVRKIREVFGALPGNGWGMTETTATVTGLSAEDYLNRPTSCGPPVAVAQLKVLDEDGKELPPGQIGELYAAGPMIVKGYWNNPEATAATFIDGWVRTGDLAWIDEEGFCYIADRAKDIVIRAGENIYSSEVENVLYEHPAVMDAAIVGIPHRTLGEEPAAVVHLTPGQSASEAELRDWVRARLAAFKVPVRILFLPETLPRNANGKILKKDLKALFEGSSSRT
jgi:acyl-CoA synthetase (AMP-forming)/AMP-acid ligase II